MLLRDEMDLARHLLGLVRVVAALPHADALAVGLVAPQRLGMLVEVVRDQRVGGAQHAVAAAVVLLQLDDLQRRIVLRQLQQVVGIGAAPGVDRLVVVAHAGEQALRPGQCLEQTVLGVVGVLALVDQQIADAFAPAQAQLFLGFQQPHRQADQVVEVDRVEGGQARLVLLVQHGGVHLARALRGGERFVRRQAGVLRARDQVARVVEHVRLAAGRQQVLELRAGVVAVEHGKAAAQPGLGMLDLQELQPQRMEGADGQPFGRIALDALGHALLHFARGLVGEGDRGDAARRHAARGNQVRDLLDDDAGLAAAGAGEHEQGAIAVRDRGALGRIEAVHGTSRGKRAAIVRGRGAAAAAVPGAATKRARSCSRPVLAGQRPGSKPGRRLKLRAWPSSTSTTRR